MPLDLDPTDLRLLGLLQADASRSFQALADAAHTSPATAQRRVRRLEAAGVIERTVALLSPDALGEGLTAIAEVTLDRQGAEHLDAFEAIVAADEAVQQCWRVSPGPDLLLVLHCRDMPAWREVQARLFTQQANVRNLKVFFATKRSKFEPRLALPAR
jgi:DNA-binding Lrp family transcriptional regulator